MPKIWEGYCEDCYEQKPRQQYDGPLVPAGSRGELCKECLESRQKDADEGKPPRPIGKPADIPNTEWVNLPDIVARPRGFAMGLKPFVVHVKFRKPTIDSPKLDDGGEVRIKFDTNPNWLPGGIIDPEVPVIRRNMDGFARSCAISILGQMFDRGYWEFV